MAFEWLSKGLASIIPRIFIPLRSLQSKMTKCIEHIYALRNIKINKYLSYMLFASFIRILIGILTRQLDHRFILSRPRDFVERSKYKKTNKAGKWAIDFAMTGSNARSGVNFILESHHR